MRLALRVAVVLTTPFSVCLLFSTSAVGQSRLPTCSNDDPESSWDNCQGTKTFASGGKYVGEFRDGKLSGQGTHTYTHLPRGPRDRTLSAYLRFSFSDFPLLNEFA
jgi:hypothetical protein